MKSRSLCTFFSIMLLFGSCRQEEKGIGEGSFRLNLQTNSEMIEMRSKSISTADVPAAEDFSISLFKGESFVNSWAKFSDFPADITFPVGGYSLNASWGDVHNEGFNRPAFFGSQHFSISDEEITPVTVICYLANVKISVSYTDNFKNYFSDYSTTINSSLGAAIKFDKNEQRAAYLKPGNITVDMALTNSTGISSNIEVAQIQNAEARSHYNLKFDVDAGNATLQVSFDTATDDYPISIDISDEALTTLPPSAKAIGFNSDEVLEFVEGNTSSALQAVFNARAGFSSLTLKTQSPYLLQMGCPALIDLATADLETLKPLTDLGLIVKGIGAHVNSENFALVDFTDLLKNLFIYGESDFHAFTLVAKDKNKRISDPIILNVRNLPNQFAVLSADDVKMGSEAAVFSVRLQGDPSRIEFYYQTPTQTWEKLTQTNVLHSDGDIHQIKTSGLPVKNTGATVRAHHVTQISSEIKINATSPTFEAEIAPADVWAHKACLKIVSDISEDIKVVLEYGKIYLRKSGESNWVEHTHFEKSADGFILNNLSDNTTYSVAVDCHPSLPEEVLPAGTFSTEIALQLPNSEMEHWFSNKTDRNGNPITKNLKYVYWNKFFPWSETDSQTQGWNTLNQLTTRDGAAPSVFIFPTAPYVGCCYVANSGTIPTTDAYSGTNAALIRTVGWGSGSTATGESSTVKRTTAGELYLGYYDTNTSEAVYGIDFTSRPTGLSFYYKYLPKNNTDRFVAEIVVLDADNNIIAQNALPENECGENTSYTLKTISLSYVGENAHKKAARMYVRFVSGFILEPNSQNFDLPEFGNLSNAESVSGKLYVDKIELLYN